MVRLLVAALLATAAFGGCTLFDDDPPANTCKTSADCFRAQGETCNTTKHVCETTIDAGVDAP
jgi:hypothetical protein